MLEQFNATIDKLYSAAADPRRWPEAFAAVEQFTDCAGMVVNVVAKRSGDANLTMFGPRVLQHGAREDVNHYDLELMAHCPRIAAGIARPNAPYLCDYMILTEPEMDRNPVYDWYGRHGLRYFVGAAIGETRGHRLMWSLQRTRAQGHVQEADIRTFKSLAPHVSRAVTLADELSTLRSFERFSSAVLDSLPNAMVALAADGRVLFANAAAARLLARGDGLVLAEGHLRTRAPIEQSRLDGLVRQALTPNAQGAQCWTVASRRCGGSPYAIFVSPLRIADADPLAAAARVLVVVHDVAERRQVDPLLLTAMHGLTEAEARLASALGGGHSVESAAALLGTKPSTARAHLKAVFRKLGVNRQQDLVRMLAGLSASVAAL